MEIFIIIIEIIIIKMKLKEKWADSMIMIVIWKDELYRFVNWQQRH